MPKSLDLFTPTIMENSAFLTASGDSSKNLTEVDKSFKPSQNTLDDIFSEKKEQVSVAENVVEKTVKETDLKLKERIEQCKSIIRSLKNEISDEKAKFENESLSLMKETLTTSVQNQDETDKYDREYELFPIRYEFNESFDHKFHCDDSLLEYEKQLQKYQNTLNLAQMEKKNAIRKQMLAKAFKLKLMEVENQCNIELLRVKQSLQCLEPLQNIAKKWKTNSDLSCDLNNYNLIPIFPEVNYNIGKDFNQKIGSTDNLKAENSSTIDSDLE